MSCAVGQCGPTWSYLWTNSFKLIFCTSRNCSIFDAEQLDRRHDKQLKTYGVVCNLINVSYIGDSIVLRWLVHWVWIDGLANPTLPHSAFNEEGLLVHLLMLSTIAFNVPIWTLTTHWQLIKRQTASLSSETFCLYASTRPAHFGSIFILFTNTNPVLPKSVMTLRSLLLLGNR